MPELTLQNIEQISRDILKQEINFSHLREELIDHVCCDVENEMHNGLSFSDAYEKVRLKIGSGRFSQIQKDTLYAVDLKYRNMRNIMKISGIAGIILLSFAALFKIRHWPLAGMLMTMGAITLALIFLPSSLGILWKETHNKRRLFLFISAFTTGAFFIAGTLFKVQHWPGAGVILMISLFSAVFMFIPAIISNIFREWENKRFRAVSLTGITGATLFIAGMIFKIQHWPLATFLMFLGIITLAFIALPWYTWLNWKNESNVDPKFIFLLLACLSVIVPGSLLNLNIQYDYRDGYYLNNDRQNAFSDYLSENNSLLINTVTDTSATESARRIHSETILLLNQIDLIENKLFEQARGQQENSPDLLPGYASRKQLDAMIQEYMDFISVYLPEYINMVRPMVVLPSDDIKNISPLSGMNSLGLLKSTILTCENAALRSLSSADNTLNATK